MWPFTKKPYIPDDLLDELHVEFTDDEIKTYGNITQPQWLAFIDRVGYYTLKLLKKYKVKNFLTLYLTLKGQELEVSLIAPQHRGPTTLLFEAQAEIDKLQQENKQLQDQIKVLLKNNQNTKLKTQTLKS